jgi:hypothetical protein
MAADLHLIRTRPSGAPSPAKDLGTVGTALWHGILAEFEFDNRASLETLSQACRCADRAEACREQIAADGVMIRTKTAVRDHPLIKHEIAARALCVRTLARLGCDLEPINKEIGRPRGS